MSEQFDHDRPKETPTEAIERLRAELDAGEMSVRAELAENLVRAAHEAAEDERFEDAIRRTDEAIDLMEWLVDEGEFEFRSAAGRCKLFRSALIRTQRGAEAGLVAFNETVRYLTENLSPDDSESRSSLAVALMNKADILIDPLGAHSAAIAAQSQALRLWRQLVDEGLSEYRHQLASTLLALGDAKLQTGDTDSALADIRQALDLARDAEEEARESDDGEESELKDVLMQALMKLTKLYERIGNISGAFDALHEVIGEVERSVAAGNLRAEPALTSLYLERGMLFERIGDPEAAVGEYERSRDVYHRMLRREPLEGPVAYLVRTGLANVLMCRGNMLADLKRYDEAAKSFEESIRCYRESTEFRPESDGDDTFIPYSIAVVQLNLANMLVARKRFQEAIDIKLEAIELLRRRFDAGHREILPNIISAYRKLIGIRRTRGESDLMFREIDEIEQLLAETVESGELEYRSDLGSVRYLRAVLRSESGDIDAAEKDFLLALRLFRELADEDAESADIQWAKLQWGEILEHLARLYVHRGRVDDALLVFRKAVDDVHQFYSEGNERLLFDILFAYSQFVEFVDTFLREESEQYAKEDIERWTLVGIKAADEGIALCRQERSDFDANAVPEQASIDDRSLDLFFRMKIAFFRRHRSSMLLYVNRFDEAIDQFAVAAGEWEALLDEITRLRFRALYYEGEKKAERGEPANSTDDSDPYAERWKYYVGELRQTLQQWALACLSSGKVDEAESLFQRDLDLTRKLVEQKAPNADRFLILSLMTFAKAMESIANTDRALGFYDEAAGRIRTQLDAEGYAAADLAMYKHVFVSFALFLHKIDRAERSEELMNEYLETLRNCREFPEPELWIDLCRALEVRSTWGEGEDKELRHELLARHPLYGSSPELAAYEESPDKEAGT